MKTQISKESHRPVKRYSGVYQQQGRMLTDADWGELMELVKLRLDDALRDVIDTGAPRERGVEISQGADGALQINGTHLYADGVKAIVAPAPKPDGSPGDMPFPYDGQADFPDAPPVPDTQAICIYGDVWERPVIALEDQQLLDPALHRADTCTRTQTMAQIKWCPHNKDPEDRPDNPQKGNATVTVSLHAKLPEKDPCDPCADVVGPKEGIGNYLFRLEVHDVKGRANAPDEITLKWSSENGAEQHTIADAPDDFSTGSWVWEFYDLISEKHLGVHLAAGFVPHRGALVTAFPANPSEDPTVGTFPFVRRWDGYVVLERQADGAYEPATDADGNFVGTDKNASLSPSIGPQDKSHGAVLTGDAFRVHLESLTLTVTLKGNTVVAGDYWLAVVREKEHAAGVTILEAAEPLGIRHHYITLAKLNADGTLAKWEDGSEEWRKLHFPPLTDLDAGDVGFDKTCDTSIYKDAHPKTVQEALELLCDIRADHVSYKAERPCQLLAPAKTVKDALDLLCTRPLGRGCKVPVGDGVEFPNIKEAIMGLLERNRRDDGGLVTFNLCLLPGRHILPKQSFFTDLWKKLSGLYSLSLYGSGTDSAFLIVDDPTTLEMRSCRLRDLTVVCRGSGTNVTLQCEEINLIHICFEATAKDSRTPALILDGRERIDVAHCTIVAYGKTSFEFAGKMFAEIEVMKPLSPSEVLFDRPRFVVTAQTLALHIAEFSQDKREALAEDVSTRIDHDALTTEEVESYLRLAASLTQPRETADVLVRRFAADLDRIRLAAATAAAVRDRVVTIMVPNAQADCLFDHNDIVGPFSVYGLPAARVTSVAALYGRLLGPIQEHLIRFESTQRTLQLRNNHLTQMLVAKTVIDELDSGDRPIVKEVFGTLLLSDNVFRAANNRFVARGHSFTATRFDHAPDAENPGRSLPAGIVIGDNGVYVGTVGRSENVVFEGDRMISADIKLYDTTRRQAGFPTESATFRLQIL